MFLFTGALAVTQVLLTFALDWVAICERDEFFFLLILVACFSYEPRAVPRVRVVYNAGPHAFFFPLSLSAGDFASLSLSSIFHMIGRRTCLTLVYSKLGKKLFTLLYF